MLEVGKSKEEMEKETFTFKEDFEVLVYLCYATGNSFFCTDVTGQMAQPSQSWSTG